MPFPFVPVLSAIGGLASAFGKTKTKDVAPDVYNAYGERNKPIQGAIEARDRLFRTINDPAFGSASQRATDDYVTALRNASSDPRLTAGSDYASSVLRGDYLDSPIVRDYADKAYESVMGAGADQAARTKASFDRAGLGFGTGLAQALQSTRTAAAQKAAAMRAGILAENYGRERGFQQQAPGMLQDAVAQPSRYLSGVTGALYQPLQLQAGLTTQLLGNNQVRDPMQVQQPGLTDRLAKGVSTGTSLYDLLSKIKLGGGATTGGG